jgi:ABC-type amino acid transport system permease subunit
MLLSGASLWVGIAGSLVLWALSGTLAVLIGLILAAGSLSPHSSIRVLARVSVNLTRGIPTSLFVIAAGIGAMQMAEVADLPIVFPGTAAAFQHLAWAIMLALAVGSAGHLAEIFGAARAALGRARLEQAAVLGLSRLRHAAVIARECAAVALPPTGTRLIHDLHNTAFAALFPVAELFGAIQGQAAATFQVLHFALLGCAIYALLSGIIWVGCRLLEAAFTPLVARGAGTGLSAWS